MTPSDVIGFDGVYFVFVFNDYTDFTPNLRVTWLRHDVGTFTTYDLKDTSKFRRGFENGYELYQKNAKFTSISVLKDPITGVNGAALISGIMLDDDGSNYTPFVVWFSPD